MSFNSMSQTFNANYKRVRKYTKFGIKYVKSEEVASPCEEETEQNLKKDLLQFSTIPFQDNLCSNKTDDDDFVWNDYLQETASNPAPPNAFKHVEQSLQNSSIEGMGLEIGYYNNEDKDLKYWIAIVCMTSGPLIWLKFLGDKHDKKFCREIHQNLYQLGWSKKNNLVLEPPEQIKSQNPNLNEFLKEWEDKIISVPENYLNGSIGIVPAEQIRMGACLEILHELEPTKLWLVQVLENVGGRLLLRYAGSEDSTFDFWLFFLHYRLHPVGWGASCGRQYSAPTNVNLPERSAEEWTTFTKKLISESEKFSVPKEVFQGQEELVKHNFEQGQKLEALDQRMGSAMYPATIIEICDPYFFIVEIDDLISTNVLNRVRMCCHLKSPFIFPTHWCKWKGLRLNPPKGWPNDEFSWIEYLNVHEGDPITDDLFNPELPDHSFKRGQKLEAVNPNKPSQICAATITRIIDHLMWINLESSTEMIAHHIVNVNSQDIFPIGWCESNNYSLKPPRQTTSKKCSITESFPLPTQRSLSAEEYRTAIYKEIVQGNAQGDSMSWCPAIYFNHQCFSGPFLSKGRVAELPRSVGPGPISLVLKEVLGMVINVAYRSTRVLRELQVDGPCNPTMQPQIIKAKYKCKSYSAPVEVCCSKDQVDEFCRQICIKLESCPYLFGLHLFGKRCPANCIQLMKTKYISAMCMPQKKENIKRPNNRSSNTQSGFEHGRVRKSRNKRSKVNLMSRKKRYLPVVSNNTDAEAISTEPAAVDELIKSYEHESGTCPIDVKTNQFNKQHPNVPKDISTRSRRKQHHYSFEKKTHRKILLDTRGQLKPNYIRDATQQNKCDSNKMLCNIAEAGKLDSNPLHWKVPRVVAYLKNTDCSHMARLFRDEEIDGQAMLLLNLPTVQSHLNLKLGPAIKLCSIIEKLKLAFYEQFT